ncbi:MULTISPECIES: hypothetical protein [Capnocytophaga]|jgi:hypothetical protein|uniref:hypothetical protein n=1 Tax=Capnocytophaga TaxID=1016 RepID=UPI00193339F6|nr:MULTISPECIES: hypothetical protein [Capnocytophaga]MBM0659755.1 hypothetical protein [Capnocytophaga genosp. AHN8471]
MKQFILFLVPLFLYSQEKHCITFTDNTYVCKSCYTDYYVYTDIDVYKIDSIHYTRKEFKASFYPCGDGQKGDNFFLLDTVARFLPKKIKRKVHNYYHKKRLDTTAYLFIQEKDSFPAVVLEKNAPFIERMGKKTKSKKRDVTATSLVFSIFVKGKTYHQIVVEKLKE